MKYEALKDECESPIEVRMLEAMGDVFHDDVAMTLQRTVVTPERRFRVDFWIEYRNVVRVVECDGRDFHEFNPDRDRDLLILGHSPVRTIFRFRGCDITHWCHSCIATIHAYAPDLFEASAAIPDAAEQVLLSNLLFGPNGHKPIVRTRFVITPGIYHLLDREQTSAYLGPVGDGTHVVGQFKTPYWKKQAESGISVRLLGEANP